MTHRLWLVNVCFECTHASLTLQLVANDTRQQVKQEEEEALKKATETEEIATSAQKDLDEALPALVCHSLCLFSM